MTIPSTLVKALSPGSGLELRAAELAAVIGSDRLHILPSQSEDIPIDIWLMRLSRVTS